MALTPTGFSGPMLASAGKPGDVDTVLRNQLGSRTFDLAGNEYIYLAGVASCVLDDVVTFTSGYVAVRITANAVGPVAIASGAVLAANWGWFLIAGFGTANSDTVAAANGLFIDGTDGRVDDASVAGDFIVGMLATGADVANKLPVYLRYPYVTNTVPA